MVIGRWSNPEYTGSELGDITTLSRMQREDAKKPNPLEAVGSISQTFERSELRIRAISRTHTKHVTWFIKSLRTARVCRPVVPLRSPYHSVEQWLVDLLEPALTRTLLHILRGTFQFANQIQGTGNTTEIIMPSSGMRVYWRCALCAKVMISCTPGKKLSMNPKRME